MSIDEEAVTELRDDEQVRLVQRLRAAGGAPLDFDELRAMGFEHPAVLCYELEIAGVPIVQTRQSDRRMLALDTSAAQLEQDDERAGDGDRPAPAEPPAQPVGIGLEAVAALRRLAATAARLRDGALRRGARWRATPRWLTEVSARLPDPATATIGVRGRLRPMWRRAGAAMSAANARRPVLAAWLALAAVLVAALAIALSGPVGVSRPNAGPSRSHGAPARHSIATTPRPPAAPPRREATPTGVLAGAGAGSASVHVSPAAAAALELEGHTLLAEGRYAAAIDRLLGAVRASGQSSARCAEPSTESCLTFAYALYDLGRALRLNGQASAAVPVLSERLRIDNQRSVVQHELELARGAKA